MTKIFFLQSSLKVKFQCSLFESTTKLQISYKFHSLSRFDPNKCSEVPACRLLCFGHTMPSVESNLLSLELAHTGLKEHIVFVRR